MRRKLMTVLTACILMIFACGPFQLSPFPSFLTDLDVYRDLAGLLPEAEHFELFTLNDGGRDFVFVLAFLYSDTRRLYAFDENLNTIDVVNDNTPPDYFRFGSRHFVDVNNYFVIGNCVFTLAPGFVFYRKILQYDMTGYPDLYSEGFGGAVMSGGLSNAIIDNQYNQLSVKFYNSSWTSYSHTDYPSISAGSTMNYNLVYSRRFGNLSDPFYSGAVFVFREQSEDNAGFAVILTDGSDMPTGGPLIDGVTPPCNTINLGSIEEQAWATFNGIIIARENGKLALIDWSQEKVTETSIAGYHGKKIVDYGLGDFYYLFDPATLKLYKARNWWLK